MDITRYMQPKRSYQLATRIIMGMKRRRVLGVLITTPALRKKLFGFFLFFLVFVSSGLVVVFCIASSLFSHLFISLAVSSIVWGQSSSTLLHLGLFSWDFYFHISFGNFPPCCRPVSRKKSVPLSLSSPPSLCMGVQNSITFHILRVLIFFFFFQF